MAASQPPLATGFRLAREKFSNKHQSSQLPVFGQRGQQENLFVPQILNFWKVHKSLKFSAHPEIESPGVRFLFC